MKRILSMLAGAALVLALGAPTVADEKTVTGELVDVQCHAKRGDQGAGEAHAGCAMACAKKGAPLGILASDAVYTVTGEYTEDNNARLLDFVAKRVKAKGTVAETDGQKTIQVTSISLAEGGN